MPGSTEKNHEHFGQYNGPVGHFATTFCSSGPKPSVGLLRKGTSKVVPVFFKPSTTPRRRIKEWSYSSTHSLTSALDGGE
jgi:hypothetical protein